MYVSQLLTLADAFRENPALWMSVVAAIVVIAVILIPVISYLIQKKRIKDSVYIPSDIFAEDVPEQIAVPNYSPAAAATAIETPVVEEQPAAATETPVVEEQPAAATETPATEEQPAVATETPATEEQPAATTEAPAVEEQPAAATETPAVEEQSAAAAQTPATEEQPAATSEAPARTQRGPVVENSNEDVGALFSGQNAANRNIDVFNAPTREDLIESRLRRSFIAKLIQSTDELKDWYSDLCNLLLSYKKVKSRISRPSQTFKYEKVKFLQFKIVGKMLVMYILLDPDTVDRKFRVKTVEKKGNRMSVLRIKSPRTLGYAREMILQYLGLVGAELKKPAKIEHIDYAAMYPWQCTADLIESGEIRVAEATLNGLLGYSATVDVSTMRIMTGAESITAESNADIDAMNAAIEAAMHEMEAAESEANEAESDTDTADVAAAAVSDDIENTNDYSLNGHVGGAVGALASNYRPIYRRKKSAKKSEVTVYLYVIGAAFEAGETVNAETLKAKGLIPAGTRKYKVIGDKVTKPLKVYADAYSQQARVAIVSAGGEANLNG